MKLRTQILWIGISGAAVAVLVGAAGLASVHSLVKTFDGAVGMGHAAQSSQSASMMNGAVRADVQKALLGAIGRDTKQIEQARRDLELHVKTFNDAMQTLSTSPLSPEAMVIIDKTRPLGESFITSAQKIAQLAGVDTAAAAMVPDFQKLSAQLEEQMALQVSAIQNDQQRFTTDSERIVFRASALVVTALALGTLGLILGALAIARHLSAPMTYAAQVSRQLAQGELDVDIHPHGNHETLGMLTALRDMRAHLSDMVALVKLNANQVALASMEIAQGNQDLSQRTERQAGSLAATASAIKQLTDTVDRNASSAEQANRFAIAASGIAASGGAAVQGVVDTMRSIDESAKQIASIIGVIDNIAFQTNVLALNASVEAARAGELGRGFSVVAAEVRSLATRATSAAKEIKTLIAQSTSQVELGSQMVGKAGDTMVEVVSSIQGVTQMVGEIHAANAQQSTTMSSIGHAIQDIDDVTQRNAALVEQMAAAAAGLSGQAKVLVEAVGAFRLKESGSASHPD